MNSVMFQCGLIKRTLQRKRSALQVARNQKVEQQKQR